MAKSKKQLHEELRARFMESVIAHLTEQGEEILQTGSQEIAIPCVDSEGNDEYVVITFKVPTGSRDGDPYDGYGMAQSYTMKVQADAEKKAEAERKKQAKIARDKAQREALAKAKAKHLAEKGEG